MQFGPPSGQVHDFRPRVFFLLRSHGRFQQLESIQRGLHYPCSGKNRVFKPQFKYLRGAFSSISTEKLPHSGLQLHYQRTKRGVVPADC